MQQLFTDVKNPRRLLAVIVLGVGLFALTRLAGEAQAVTGMSPSGRLQFTKGFEPFYFPGNSQLTAVTGRSCTINKMSSSSALIITYHENVSSVGAPGNHRFSSIHLYLNGVHMSGRQLYVPNPNEPLQLGDTPVSMCTAITGGAAGQYTVQVAVAGAQPLNFGGRDMNIGQPLDYTITMQEIQ